MTQLQIKTVLPVANALACAITEHGTLLVSPNEEQLQQLSEEYRVALAPYCVEGRNTALLVARPGWDGVVEGLEEEIQKARKTRDEQLANIEMERASYRHQLELLTRGEYFQPGSIPPDARGDLHKMCGWTSAPNYGRNDAECRRLWAELEIERASERERLVRVADTQLTELMTGRGETAEPTAAVLALSNCPSSHAPRSHAVMKAISEERKAAVEQRRAENRNHLRQIIIDAGRRDQIERFDAGVLPLEEQTELVESVLFSGLKNFARYDEISEQEVAEECECEVDDVKFSSSNYDGPFGPESWALLQRIRAAAGENATVQAREHVGYEKGRDDSDDPEIRRQGIRVTILFAGEKYAQEFAAS